MSVIETFRPSARPARPAPARPAGWRPSPAARSGARRTPGPSRLAYRLHRIWLRPLYRRLLRVGVPLLLATLLIGGWLEDADRRAALITRVNGAIIQIQHRKEFMVDRLTIEGASPAVAKALREMLPVSLPASSFDLDLPALRAQLEQLDAIEHVDLRIRPGGEMSAVVTERQPALLWRRPGAIDILDRTGHRVASLTSREVRRDLPMIAGQGAATAAPEALALIGVAGPLLPRLRGLERMGERRWDLVLDRGQRIMLPEQGAVPALEGVLQRDRDNGLLSRDVVAVDLRDPGRPVLRLGLAAQNRLRTAQGLPLLDENGALIEEDSEAAPTGAAARPRAAAGQAAARQTGKTTGKAKPAGKAGSRPAAKAKAAAGPDSKKG